MKISASVFCLVLFFYASGSPAQSPDTFVPIPPASSQLQTDFIDGETTIGEVEFVGMDTDSEEAAEPGDSLYQAEFIKRLRGSSMLVKKGDSFSRSKVLELANELREWVSSSGYPLASVTALGMELPDKRTRVRFVLERGPFISTTNIIFSGNERVPTAELVEDFKDCGDGLWKKYKPRVYSYIAQSCTRRLLHGKGFWKAQIVELIPQISGGAVTVKVVVSEGTRYRLGDIKIEGNKAFASNEIHAMLGQQTGDIADGKKFQRLVFDTLKRKYDELGYVQYDAEFDPEFVELRDASSDGTVNVLISISEGKKFKVGIVDFEGVRSRDKSTLDGEFSMRPGDPYSGARLQEAVERFNELGRFARVDKDRDINVFVDEESGTVDLMIHLKKLEP